MRYNLLFAITSVLVFLRPHLDMASSVVAVYLADVAILVLVVLSPFCVKHRIYVRHKDLLFVSIVFVLGLLIPTTVNFLTVQSTIDMLVEYGKFLYYAIVFWFLYSLIINSPDIGSIVNKTMDICFSVIFAISLVQLLDPPILGNVVRDIYGTAKLRDILSGNSRVYGSFYNANWFGIYLVFFLAWLNSRFINHEVTLRYYVIKGAMLISLFVISGSRTALVGALLCLALQFVGLLTKRNVVLVTGALAVLYGVLGVVQKIPQLARTLSRFAFFMNALRDHGLKMSELNVGRWNAWQQGLDTFREHPFFGSGAILALAHNSYLSFLILFGLFGAAVVAFCFVMIVVLEKRWTDITLKDPLIVLWKRGFLPSFLVMSLAGEFVFATQVMLLVVMLYALEKGLETSVTPVHSD